MRPSDNLIAYANGVDVLLHESCTPDAYSSAHPDLPALVIKAIESVHTTPTQAGEIFSHTKPGLAIFYRIDPGKYFADELTASARKAYNRPLEVSEDLIVIMIGDKIEAQQPSP